jgi:hypothetical protein
MHSTHCSVYMPHKLMLVYAMQSIPVHCGSICPHNHSIQEYHAILMCLTLLLE